VEGGGGRWRKVEEGGGRWRKVEEGGEKCEYIRLSSSDRCPSSSLYLHQVIQHVGHVFVFLRQVHHLRLQVHHTLLLVLLVLQDLEINQIEKRLVVIILEIVLTHKIKI
jgi:hypothetical protein